jgi:nitrogen fixation protein
VAIKETVFYDGGPHKGDLILGVLLAFTVICLPISVGAIVRALWLRYRITDRRISIVGGWLGRQQTDAIYSEVSGIVSVPRGFGAWGDIVLTLKDGSRLEMRAVPDFRSMVAYLEERVAAKGQPTVTPAA